MSLLGDIWGSITSWVMSYVASAIAGIQRIVNNVWNTFVTYVTNSYNYWTQVIQNTINNIVQYVSNTYQYITQNIMNVVNNTVQYVTNVVGVTEKWVTDRIAGIDTVGFFRDPLGYIRAAFTQFIAYYVFSAADSFAKGLEAGIPYSSPAKERPDSAFERGFLAALEEQEGHV